MISSVAMLKITHKLKCMPGCRPLRLCDAKIGHQCKYGFTKNKPQNKAGTIEATVVVSVSVKVI